MPAFMIKVTIVFTSLLRLWDYKGILNKRLVQTKFTKRSLTCFCTEAEIELARHAYHASVEEMQ